MNVDVPVIAYPDVSLGFFLIGLSKVDEQKQYFFFVCDKVYVYVFAW